MSKQQFDKNGYEQTNMTKGSPDNVAVNTALSIQDTLERAGERFLNEETEYDQDGHPVVKHFIPVKPPKNQRAAVPDYVPIAKAFTIPSLTAALVTQERFYGIMKDIGGHLSDRKGLTVKVYDDVTIIVSETYNRHKAFILSFELKTIIVRETIKGSTIANISQYPLDAHWIMQTIGNIDRMHSR